MYKNKLFKIVLLFVIFSFLIVFAVILWHSSSIINSMVNVRIEKNDGLLDIYKDEIERIDTLSEDGLIISAWRFKVENPKGIIIVTHGMHGMDASSLLDYGKFFKDEGYEAFVLDMRAHGHSDGDVIGLGFTEVYDFDAILTWIQTQNEYRHLKIALYGLSMGGSAAINAAAQNERVDAVISVSAYESIETQIISYMKNSGVPSFVISMYKPAFRLYLYGKYKVNPTKQSPLQTIKQITPRPMILIHGDMDEQTSVQQAYNLKKQAGENAQLWIVEGKGHFIVDNILAEDSHWYRERIIQFLHSNLR